MAIWQATIISDSTGVSEERAFFASAAYCLPVCITST